MQIDSRKKRARSYAQDISRRGAIFCEFRAISLDIVVLSSRAIVLIYVVNMRLRPGPAAVINHSHAKIVRAIMRKVRAVAHAPCISLSRLIHMRHDGPAERPRCQINLRRMPASARFCLPLLDTTGDSLYSAVDSAADASAEISIARWIRRSTRGARAFLVMETYVNWYGGNAHVFAEY